MLVDRLLTGAAEREPRSEALICGGRRLTYAQLEDWVARVAAGFRAQGVRRGDRVAVCMENSVEGVLSIFGAFRAGAVAVPLNATLKTDKLAYILQHCDARAVAADRRTASTVLEAAAKVPGLLTVVAGDVRFDSGANRVVTFDELGTAAPPVSSSDAVDVDLAALIYTSGSTGRPKGVMMSHANVVAATTSINAYLRTRPVDTILNVLPLSFDYGLYQLFLAADAGARLVLDSFVYPGTILQLLAREAVTIFPVVPTLAGMMLGQDLEGHDLRALRSITNTGAAFPARQIVALRRRLPHVQIFSMYGLTECKRVSYLPPEDIDARPLSVGRPMDNVEAWLVDEQGARVARGGTGQLVVRGANVMQGYWNDQAETALALRPGPLPGERVLYTGDLFRVDDDGYLYFESRTDDVIKCRGQKVSPREVENALYALPDVAEAIVTGVADDIAGTAVKAYVALRRGASLSENDILLHCSKHLEDFMVPRVIEIVDALPRTSSGKLTKPANVGLFS